MIDELDHLDRAVRSALGDIVARAPEANDQPLRVMPTVLAPRSRRVPVMVGAAALVAAAGLALVVVATPDGDEQDSPAGDGTTGPATFPTIPANAETSTWPVRLAPSVVPFYVVDDAFTASLTTIDGPARGTLTCALWKAAAGVVTCSALSGEGYLPSVIYTLDDDGRHYVEISTLHADIGIREYATNFSHGKDVGYDEPALPVEDVTVGAWAGALVEIPNAGHRVTVEPTPGTLVAIEIGSSYSREDLLAIAADLRPVTITDQFSDLRLVIAQSSPDADGMRVTALGGVRDGEVCLLTDAGCAPLLGDTPLLAQHTGQPSLVGLADDRVASLRFEAIDHTTVTLPLDAPTIGTVRAFAIAVAPGAAVVPLDAEGVPIPLTGGSILTVPMMTDAVPTTVTILDTTSTTS